MTDPTTEGAAHDDNAPQHEVDASIYVQHARGVLWRQTLEGVVMLHPDHAAPTVASGPAADVWAASSAPTSVPTLIEAIVARYDHPPAETRTELARVIDELRHRGLLTDTYR